MTIYAQSVPQEEKKVLRLAIIPHTTMVVSPGQLERDAQSRVIVYVFFYNFIWSEIVDYFMFFMVKWLKMDLK